MSYKFKNYIELLESVENESQSDSKSKGDSNDNGKTTDGKTGNGDTVLDGSAADSSGKMVDGKKILVSGNPNEKSDPRDRVQYCVDEPKDDEVIRDIEGNIDNAAIMETHLDENANFIAYNIDDQLDNLNSGERGEGKSKGFFILGHAGWGKTSVIKKVAKEFGLTIITVYLDKALPEDLGGIPSLKNEESGASSVTYAMPPWAAYMYNSMQKTPERKFLLFFDEMNQASGEVQNTLMPIVLERTICGIRFNNFVIGAAGNYKSENDYLTKLSDPLTSRFGGAYEWTEDWAEAIKYLEEEYGDAFEPGYEGECEDANKQPYKCNPFEEATRWRIFKDPRDLEIHVLLYLINRQRNALKGHVAPANFLKRDLIRVVNGAVMNEKYDGSNNTPKYVFKEGGLVNNSDLNHHLDDICKYFHTYYEHLAESRKNKNLNVQQDSSKNRSLSDLAKSTTKDISPVEGLTPVAYQIIKANLEDRESGWTFENIIDKFNSFGDEETGLTSEELLQANEGTELSGEIVSQLYNDAKETGWYAKRMKLPESMKKEKE